MLQWTVPNAQRRPRVVRRVSRRVSFTGQEAKHASRIFVGHGASRGGRRCGRLEHPGDPPSIEAQALVDPTLNVSTVVSGLEQPIAMAFIGPDDLLVTEKATGQVKRVTAGAVAGVVLDLAVNSSSERGLLGIALHPRFPRVPFVYLYNTENTTGADSNVLAEVPLLGNRVDRFIWNGSTLTFDRNIIRLRAFQNDRNNVADPTLPVLRGNHNGGVLRFGPDRKLYIIFGDNGRRGLTQNNLGGPVPDDDFGGPLPDDAHFTGVVLRLDDDGRTPRDNPFFFGSAATAMSAASASARTRSAGSASKCSATSSARSPMESVTASA